MRHAGYEIKKKTTYKSPKRLELVDMEEVLKAGHVVDDAREMHVSDIVDSLMRTASWPCKLYCNERP